MFVCYNLLDKVITYVKDECTNLNPLQCPSNTFLLRFVRVDKFHARLLGLSCVSTHP
jgi:hypothetical protein